MDIGRKLSRWVRKRYGGELTPAVIADGNWKVMDGRCCFPGDQLASSEPVCGRVRMPLHLAQRGVGYLVASTLIGAIAAFRIGIADLPDDHAPFLPFLVAVTVAGWCGGLWPGLFATVACSYVAAFFFVSPHGDPGSDLVSQPWPLLLFVCSGLAVSGLCEAMHADRRKLELRGSRERWQEENAETWKARYEAAVKASRSVLYNSNHQTGQVTYGGDCESILGYSPSEINGDISKWISLIHPDDREAFLLELKRMDREGSSYQADYRMRRKDGQIVWVRDDGHHVVQEGAAVHVVGFVRDVTDRVRAEHEQERRRMEERLTRLMDHTPLAVVEFGADYRITRWAGQAEKLFGWRSQEVVGRSYDEFRFVFEEDLPQVEEIVLKIDAMSDNCIVSRNRNYRKSGEVIDCDWYSSVLRDEDGQLIAVLSLVQDVTERERAADALRESEARFRHLADAMPQLVWTADTEGRITYFNNRIQRFSGASRKAGDAWDWQPMVHPNDLEKTIHAKSEALKNQAPCQFEHRLRMSDGSYRWHLSRCLPVVGSPGEVEWFGTSTDVHDLKESESALQASQERFRAFVDSSPAAVWSKSESGHYVFLNRAYQQRFGVRMEDWLGKTDRDVWPEEIADSQRRNDEKALQSTAPIETFEEFVEQDGRPSVWRIIRFVYSDAGGGKYVGGIGYDVTEQRKNQAELAELATRLADADRRKDDFLATLAHELRNPLAPIRTGLEVLELAGDQPAIIEEVRRTMERQTRQLISLVDDLLDVSRITRDKLELRKCRVEFSEVVRTGIEAAQPAIDAKHQQLLVDLPGPAIRLEADPHRLAQVVSNLLVNASNYTPDGGHIWLAAERQGSDVVLNVRDDGIGIPADMHHRIFEMFAQIEERSMEKGYRGLGIGLTLVKQLVQLHGGTVDVVSEGVSRGSEFRVRLPGLSEVVSDGEPVDASGTAVADGGAIRVLIADDNAAVAETLGMVVTMVGHEVRTACDGEQAIEAAAAFLPDVVLMDIGMPKMNGYEAARHIRQQPWGQGMMLIALTGWGQDDDKDRATNAGFDQHLVKPVGLSDLRQLFALVGQRHSESQNRPVAAE